MDELFLAVHVDLLRRNLESVAGVLGDIDEKLSRPSNGHELNSDRIRKLIDRAKKVEDLLGAQGFESRFGPEDVDDAEEPMDPVLLLTHIRLELVQIALRVTKSDEPRDVMPIERDDLQIDLVGKAGRFKREADDLATEVAAAVTPATWTKFFDLERRSRVIFDEYVDLIRGVAVRSSGFDRDLCPIADSILREIGVGYRWKSISIPARAGFSGMSTGKLVRLGFPDWTVWTLPLVVYEFGHIALERDDTLKAYLDTLGSADAESARVTRTLLIDAFATEVMGPAYACATILIRLDPAAKGPSATVAARRVATILEVLGRDNPPGPVRGLAERLKQAWSHAVEQSGGPTPHFDPLDAEATNLVANATFALRFPLLDWQTTVEPWATALQQQKVERVRLNASAGLRHLLNAAWRCRVAPIGDVGTAVESLDDVESIGNAVCGLATQWIQGSSGSANPQSGENKRRSAGPKP